MRLLLSSVSTYTEKPREDATLATDCVPVRCIVFTDCPPPDDEADLDEDVGIFGDFDE
jgi:hypothetical protein